MELKNFFLKNRVFLDVCNTVITKFQGDLKFFVNGESQGVAAANLPQMLYAVVDMYGKCAQVTVTAPSTPDSSKSYNFGWCIFIV